jgi:hypothetical protein
MVDGDDKKYKKIQKKNKNFVCDHMTCIEFSDSFQWKFSLINFIKEN